MGPTRPIVKAISGSADLDCTYHFYYDNQWRIIEDRNGSDQVIKQNVFGPMYIDELIQTGINDDPTADDGVETYYFASHDANFNVLGIVDTSGALTERYDYTPYGQRTVYSHGWYKADVNDDGAVDDTDQDLITDNATTFLDPKPASIYDLDADGRVNAFDAGVARDNAASAPLNDPVVSYPRAMSFRENSLSTSPMVTPLSEFGHQGLMHDEELGPESIDNRFRYRSGPRFMQRDPLDHNEPGGGYHDGMSLYQYLGSSPLIRVDPTAHDFIAVGRRPVQYTGMAAGNYSAAKFYHYSIEYWTICQNPKRGEQISTFELKYRRDAQRKDDWELLAHDFEIWNRTPAPQGRFSRRIPGWNWNVDSIMVSVVHKQNAASTEVKVIFESATKALVAESWKRVSHGARTYPYAEHGGQQFLQQAPRPMFRNWPNSWYQIPEGTGLPWVRSDEPGNNSNTFVRYLAGAHMLEMGPYHQHPGALTPGPVVLRRLWWGTPFPVGMSTIFPHP